jgi:hypothetical protein
MPELKRERAVALSLATNRYDSLFSKKYHPKTDKGEPFNVSEQYPVSFKRTRSDARMQPTKGEPLNAKSTQPTARL